MRALSLGAGVQSTTVLLLSLEGILPPFDAVVFADTGDEPAEVYEHLTRLQDLTDIAVVSLQSVAASPFAKLSDTTDATFMPVPLYTKSGGMGRRQCTYQFKLRPIRRHLRNIGANDVDLAVCISLDEIDRAKPSGRKWVRNYWPLLDLEPAWTRADCLDYLGRHWPHPVPRSACVFCPLKSDREWIELRDKAPDDWAAAVAFDKAARPFGYVHRTAVPLDEVKLRPTAGPARFSGAECEGICGV